MTKSYDKKKHFPKPSSGTMMAAATLGLLGVTATDAAHGQGGDVLLSMLENVQSFNVLGDGTLSVVLQGGEVMTLPAGSFSVVGGEIMLTAEAAALLQTGVAAGAGAGAGAAANLAGLATAGSAGAAGLAEATSDDGDDGGDEVAQDSGEITPPGREPSGTNPPVFVSAETVDVAENAAITEPAYLAVARDPDHTEITYSLSGADASRFEIDAETGVVTFRESPDFEAAVDSDGDNAYLITVTATDADGQSAEQTVTITVTDEEEDQPKDPDPTNPDPTDPDPTDPDPVDSTAPVISSGATASVAENVSTETTVYQTLATDESATTLTYSLTGADAELFAIDGAGAVTFIASPDHEAPGDEGDNNQYTFTVNVSDGTNTATQEVVLTVTDEADSGPVFTGTATISVDENSTATGYTPVAMPDVAGAAVTYAITGGANRTSFELDATTGELTFTTAPDFEAPSVAGGNAYEVEITATDDQGNATAQTLTVEVQDVDEAPVFTSGTAIDVNEGIPNTQVVYTATTSNPFGGTVNYSLSVGGDNDLFTIDETSGELNFNSSPDFDAPGDAGNNGVYDLTIIADNGLETSTLDLAITLLEATDPNAPVFATPTLSISVDENTPLSVVAFDANATDPNGPNPTTPDDGITYTISGIDAGQFEFVVAGAATSSPIGTVYFDTRPDFENAEDADGDNIYEFTITATDGELLTSTQDVFITVQNVDEAPVFAHEPSTFDVPENDTAPFYTVVSTDPEGAAVTYSISGADAGLFSIGLNTGELSATTPLDHEDLAAGFNYHAYANYTASTGAFVSHSFADTLQSLLVEDPSPSVPGTESGILEIGEEISYEHQTHTDEVFIGTVTIDGHDMAVVQSASSDQYTILAPVGVDPATIDWPADFNTLTVMAETLDVSDRTTLDITVTASDGTTSRDQNLTITVTDESDIAPTLPVATHAVRMQEGQTSTGYVANADADIAGGTITYSIEATGGADQALFEIDPVSGALSFRSVPDYEAPDGDASARGVGAFNSVGIVNFDPVSGAFLGHTGNSSDFLLIENLWDEAVPGPDRIGARDGILEVGEQLANLTGVLHGDLGLAFAGTVEIDGHTMLVVQADNGAYAVFYGPDVDPDAISWPADSSGLAIDTSNFSIRDANTYEVEITASDGTNATTELLQVTVEDDPDEAATVINTGTLGGDGFSIIENQPYQFGRAVAIAGDINGDGYDDVFVGAPDSDYGNTGSGSAYVIFGDETNNLNDLNTSSIHNSSIGFRIDITTNAASLGDAIFGGGDLNGEGYDDLVISLPKANSNDGRIHVIFGDAAGNLGDIDNLNAATSDFRILSPTGAQERIGRSLDFVDVNGDGYDDLVFGAPTADPGGLSDAGRFYIIFGGDSLADIDLASPLDSADGIMIDGLNASTRFGTSVSGIGDFNGDGFEDVIVANRNGGVVVVYGGTNDDLATFDVTALSSDQTRGFLIDASDVDDLNKAIVTSLGDVNGDGYDDLMFNAIDRGDYGTNYIIFGRAGTTQGNIDLADTNTFDGLAISHGLGTGAGGYTSVSHAGDVNGDGYADLIIGNQDGENANSDDSGEAYIIFGGNALTDLNLENLQTHEGFVIESSFANGRLGRAVSGGGDVNGDGYDDLLVGDFEPVGGGGGAFPGRAYVIFGGNTGTESTDPVTRIGSLNSDNFTGNAGDDTFTDISLGDVVRGGAGDDHVTLTSTDFADLDGGNGTDTLAIGAAPGLSLDITAPQSSISGFEIIDLSDLGVGMGGNQLIADALSILRLSDDTANGVTTLRVLGDGDPGEEDLVVLSDFADWGSSTGTTAETIDGESVTFVIYENGNARLLVESGVLVLDPATAGAIMSTTISLDTAKLQVDVPFDGSDAGLFDFPSGGYADWQSGGFDAFADLRGEVLSLAPVGPQVTTPNAPMMRAPLPPIDQVWQDDALAATMLHLDLADPIEGF